MNHSFAADIMQMQSTHGNQAVQQFLALRAGSASVQREDDDEKPLSGGKEAAAIAYYTSQPKRYTKDIINQIQDKVGTPQTGVISSDDVQAVARWQKELNESEEPPLKIDGMAGPRTLPTLFRVGLADQDQIESYSKETHDILDKWEELGSAEARIKKLVEKVNEYLTTANVPNCKPLPSDAEGNDGQFDFGSWSLEIGKPDFEKDDPTPKQKANMADTIYHESRHAEQWYRMTQFRAGQGKTAAEIKADFNIPQEIADEAFAHPLKEGTMENLMADEMYEAVKGPGKPHRRAVLKELAAAGKALEKAKKDFKDDPTPDNKKKFEAADKRDDKAREAYYDLPEENDANRIGNRVNKDYKANEPKEEPVTP